MINEVITGEELIKMVENGDLSTVNQLVDNLVENNISDEVAKAIVKLIASPEKTVRITAAELLSKRVNPNIPSYLVKYVSSNNISIRNLTGEVLLRLGDYSVDAMLKYLEINDADDKKFLIDLLGLTHEKRAIQPIIIELNNSTNENVILACFEALGNLSAEESVEHLVKFYDVNEVYKPTIVEALGKIGSEQSLNFLMEKYRTEDSLVKFSIVESFGEIGNAETFFFLVSELNQVNGPIVWPILHSIFLLKQKFNFDIPFDERTKTLIIETINEAEPLYRKSAAHLLAEFDDAESLVVCLKIFGSDPEIDEVLAMKFGSNILLILTKLPELIKAAPENLQSLLLLLKEISVYSSQIAEVEKRNLINALSNCLNDSDEDIRRLSIEIMFELDSSIALLFADKMIEDDSIWNKMKLIEIFQQMENPEVKNYLEKLANDNDEMVRDTAASSLLNK